MATILRSSSAQLRRGLTADDLLKELKTPEINGDGLDGEAIASAVEVIASRWRRGDLVG